MNLNSSATPSLARQLNIRRVVDVLRENPPLSRAEIIKQTGISSPTMTKLINQLLSERFIEEYSSPRHSGRGRPSKSYTLSPECTKVLCAVIEQGRMYMFCAVPQKYYERLDMETFPIPENYDALIGVLRDYIGRRVASGDKLQCAALQLCCTTDREARHIMYCAQHRFLEGKSPLEEVLKGIPATMEVRSFIVPDTEALCLAETSAGSVGRGLDFAVVDIRHHLQFGVVSNGKLVRGVSGYAGSFGHIIAADHDGTLCSCGRHGCYETRGAESYWLKRLGEKFDRGNMSIEDVVELAAAGRINVVSESKELIDMVSFGVGAVINLFNPSCILVKTDLVDLIPDFIAQISWLSSRRVMLGAYAGCEVKLSTAHEEAGTIYKMSEYIASRIYDYHSGIGEWRDS